MPGKERLFFVTKTRDLLFLEVENIIFTVLIKSKLSEKALQITVGHSIQIIPYLLQVLIL